MKLIYIANSRIPTEKAHGLQIFRMCEAFVKNGNDLILLIPLRKNHIKDDPFDFYSSEKNFKITYIPIMDMVVFGKVGFLIHYFLFSVVAGFYSLFIKSDIVFTRDELVAFFQILIGKKVYWESHTGSYNFFARFVLKHASKIVAISNGLKDFYIKRGVDSEKIFVAPDAVRLEDFEFNTSKEDLRKELKLPNDKPIVMYTGHLYDWKGSDTLAQSGSNLPDYNFIFVGGTEKDVVFYRKKYEKYSNLFFVGFKKNNLIPKYLKSADLLVIPNLDTTQVSKEFTSPMKLFEYMASEVPIVASDLPSIREVVGNGAIYFKSGDVDDLCNRIVYALNEKPMFFEGSVFSWDDRVNLIIDNLDK